MGKRQRDCVDCGAPGRHTSAASTAAAASRRLRGRRRPRRAARAAARTGSCMPTTGRCVLCSRRCRECGRPVRCRDETLCRRLPTPGRRSPPRSSRARAAASPAICAKRPAGAARAPGPARRRIRPASARAAAQLRRHAGRGMCSALLAAPPRPALRARRDTWPPGSTDPPDWLGDFVAYLAARHCPAQRLHADHHAGSAARRRAPQPPARPARAGPPPRPVDGVAGPRPGGLLHRARPGDGHRPGRAARRRAAPDAGSTPHQPGCVPRSRSSPSPCCALAIGPAVPAPGPAPTDTIESALATVRDLACFLDTQRGKQDWALVDVPTSRRSSLSCRTTELDV